MRRSRPVRLIQLCRCISTTPDSGAYWRLGFRSSRPSATSTVRFGNHCSDSGGSSTRSGATCRTRRAREHGHLVAGASETRDCGCQRRPDHASLLASPGGGVPGHVTVRGRRRAGPVHIRHEDSDARGRRHPQQILTDCCFPRSVPPEPIPLKVSPDGSGVGGRPPNPLPRQDAVGPPSSRTVAAELQRRPVGGRGTSGRQPDPAPGVQGLRDCVAEVDERFRGGLSVQ